MSRNIIMFFIAKTINVICILPQARQHDTIYEPKEWWRLTETVHNIGLLNAYADNTHMLLVNDRITVIKLV